MIPRRLWPASRVTTTPWDETWGKRFMKPDLFTKIVDTELSAAKK
ncbi:MAG TPA: hypothetical protein VN896_12660 [Methylomirabilota bacterium]|nr:hypothetical protein [Methylomirabilota bacterium]